MSRFLFILLLIFTTSANAEIWNCDDSVYTDNPNSDECVSVDASVSCGKKGNKFLTPSKDSYKKVLDKCKPSLKSSSPFIDFVKLAFLKQDVENKKNAKPGVFNEDKKFKTKTAKATNQNFDLLGNGKSKLPSNVKVPDSLPPVAHEIINKYLDIWGKYDTILEDM